MLAWGAVFGLAYGQSPLYTSNQNQYFLHGLAQAGRGGLAGDWLANTADPAPLFTALVRLTASLLDERLFYVYFLLLAAIYLHSLWGIADRLFELSAQRARTLLFLTAVFVLHSAGLRTALGWMAGGWEYLFDGGVAGQRLLGTVLQPATFGTLLLLAVHQFLRDRPYRACMATAAAALMHATYLLGAAALVGGMLWLWHRQDRDLRRPLLAGGLTLALAVPILIYTARTFLPVSPAAQEILVDVRLPEHTRIAEWFDLTTLVKTGLILLAMYLARGRPLSILMALPACAAILLTIAQLVSDSDSLALLFPWRISTYLVPLATGVIVGWGARAAADRLGWSGPHLPGPALGLGLGLITLSMLSGLLWSAVQFAQQGADPARGVLDFVRSRQQPGQVFLIPPHLQDFRLAAGAAAMVDFKSIPYRGDQVLEWYDRLRLARLIYRERAEQVNCARLVDASREYRVTHIVLDQDLLELDCPGLRQLYADPHYAVAALAQDQP